MEEEPAMEVRTLIKEGEGYLVEFKESANDSIQREIVAFSNSSGGRIVIGVNDDGETVGIRNMNRTKSIIQDMAHNCDPPITVAIDRVGNLMVVDVPEGMDKPYSCREGFFIRVGPNTQKLKRNEVIELIRSGGRVRFDEQFNADFRYPRDFSAPRFKTFLTMCGITGRPSREPLLVNLGIARSVRGHLTFRNVGSLLFAKDPMMFHPHARVTCIRFKGNDKVHIIDRKDFSEDPVTNVKNAMRWLETYIPLTYEIGGKQLHRKEIPEIPYDALREALLNTMIHRDYFEHGAVTMVEFFDDRIAISNPGGLIGGMKLSDLGTRSISRNPLLFDLLNRAGLVERIGSGIPRIRELIERTGAPPPVFDSNGFFSVRFSRGREPITEPISEPIHEPISAVLDAIRDGVEVNLIKLEGITKIPRATLKRHVSLLIKRRLVRYIGSRKRGQYVLTKKGREHMDMQGNGRSGTNGRPVRKVKRN